MNVLVYAGPEVLQTSLARSLALLKSLLLQNYTVQPITAQSLASDPWPSTCALLVIPASTHHLSFSTSTSATIKSYVDNGGAFLGLKAGIKSGSINSALRFQDSVSGASLNCYFPDAGEAHATGTIALSSSTDITSIAGHAPLYFDITETFSLQVLARYSEDSRPAAIAFKAGRGRVVLWSVPIETPTSSEHMSDSQVETADSKRIELVRETLRALGLQVPTDPSSISPYPLPLILTGSPTRPSIVHHILDTLSVKPSGNVIDANDTFQFLDIKRGLELLHHARSQPTAADVKPVIVLPDGVLPSSSDTPMFNLKEYYTTLSKVREEKGCPPYPAPWGMGEALLYGEVVTSTQTMLDKNPRLLSALPVPFLCLASHQVAGRGRGGNVWTSPSGCLQFSLLLRVPLSQVPASKLVFVQYLFALAVVEACRHDTVLGRVGEALRLKWPNDVYIAGGEQKRKVGGILVHTSFTGGLVSIVIGCGLNVLNGPPIASLAQLLSPEAHSNLSLERTAATIMATFECMWNTFVSDRGSFVSFMDLYLERWLHSDQLVTITTVDPHRRVRIAGITADYGLLRTIPEREAWAARLSDPKEDFIDLQPDGNTFDIMAGLIMTKK